MPISVIGEPIKKSELSELAYVHLYRDVLRKMLRARKKPFTLD
jgi:hypothetical protein